nr:uncharacterized protein LOC107126692 isoform X1 [Macaca fascicularis]XP_045221040.1 uncharacterized protein LOC107126692 isoform X1 [Macaca fascicularis]
MGRSATERRRRPRVGPGLPRGAARGKAALPAAASPTSRGSSNFPPSARRRTGRARFRNFVSPPVALGPLQRSAPAANPRLAQTAAQAHPPRGSTSVYLRPRSRRSVWPRPHSSFPGPSHSANKFPNMDSFVRFVVL